MNDATLRDRLGAEKFAQLQADRARRAAQRESELEDDGPDPIDLSLDELIARVPLYVDRVGYESFKRELGIDAGQMLRFEKAGILLQPKQMMFAYWARKCDEPDGPEEILMGGARGPGKTFALSAQTAIDDLQRFPGLQALFLRLTKTSAKEQMQRVMTKVLTRITPQPKIFRDRVIFDNGSSILLGGFNNESQALAYAGQEYDIEVIEEANQLGAQTHEALRGSNRSSASYQGKLWRPRRYMSANPLGVGHNHLKKRFVDNERRREAGEPFDPREKFIFSTVRDNSLVNPEYLGVLESYTGLRKKAYLDGNWDISSGAYFSEWSYEWNVIPPIDDLSWADEAWVSMDFGFNHPNVCLLHVRDGDGVTYTVDELVNRWRQPEEIGPEFHDWIGKYNLTVDDLSHILAGSDVFARTGRSASTVAEKYSALGIPLSRAETSPGSRILGAITISDLIGAPNRDKLPRWFMTSRCKRLIETLGILEVDPDNSEDVLKVDIDEQGEGGDDAYDALRYGLYRPHVTTIV